MEEATVVEAIEIELLLEGVFQLSGQDFRGYQRQLVTERLRALMRVKGLPSVSALQDRVMHDLHQRTALLRALCLQPAGLFDGPGHLLALRAALGPWLRSCPSPKVWIAECTSMEEMATLAILLAEEGIYDKTQIFATTANAPLLEEARNGSFSLARMPEYEHSYRRSGGRRSLKYYCEERDGQGNLAPHLLDNITWAQYSLATDASFNEFELIVCRRTLGAFGAPLRRRALQLFYDSQPLFGMLSIDEGAELGGSPFLSRYKSIGPDPGLYRRIV